MTQPHPLTELDRRERADERSYPPRFYEFDTIEDWIVALDNFDYCAGYARMLLTAYKVAGGGQT